MRRLLLCAAAACAFVPFPSATRSPFAAAPAAYLGLVAACVHLLRRRDDAERTAVARFPTAFPQARSVVSPSTCVTFCGTMTSSESRGAAVVVVAVVAAGGLGAGKAFYLSPLLAAIAVRACVRDTLQVLNGYALP